jgi:redox-sensitive bicupin YhaK (pirin superfamily)
VHSERTSPEVRQRGQRVHGLQAWVALPPEHEDGTPSFAHWDADALPVVERGGATVRVIAGAAFGLHSPVRVASPTVYVDVQLRADSDLPLDVDAPERAIYVASGELSCDGLSLPTGTLAVLHPGTAPTLRGEARIAVLGGAPLAGPHHIWWNFVASTTERIEAAKLAWHERRFATVPGDEIEFVPAPR